MPVQLTSRSVVTQKHLDAIPFGPILRQDCHFGRLSAQPEYSDHSGSTSPPQASTSLSRALLRDSGRTVGISKGSGLTY